MMASARNTTISLREAIESLVAPEVMGPLDELAEVLLAISGTVARLRRKLDPQGTWGADLLMLDQSFSRSIVLTRALRERLQVRRGRGEYASVSHVAREIVGRLQGVIPGTVSVCLECPAGPAIVAADRSDVRRVLAGLLEIGLEAAGVDETATGRVDLDISETHGPGGERRRRVVLVELRTPGTIDEGNVRLAGAVKPLVRALGGTMTVREVLRGGTAISVRLPCAC
jgi:signal transduction histidine kinase